MKESFILRCRLVSRRASTKSTSSYSQTVSIQFTCSLQRLPTSVHVILNTLKTTYKHREQPTACWAVKCWMVHKAAARTIIRRRCLWCYALWLNGAS